MLFRREAVGHSGEDGTASAQRSCTEDTTAPEPGVCRCQNHCGVRAGLRSLQGPCASRGNNSCHTVTKSWLRGHRHRTRPCSRHSDLMAVAPAQLSWGGCGSGCLPEPSLHLPSTALRPQTSSSLSPHIRVPLGSALEGRTGERAAGRAQSQQELTSGGGSAPAKSSEISGRDGRTARPRGGKSRRSLNTQLQ